MANIYPALNLAFDEVVLEFVKNSFHAFRDSELKKDWHPDICEIDIEFSRREGVFSIRDNGPGFSKSDLKYLLGPLSPTSFREKMGVRYEISTYALGVVSAASWLGSNWEISTKRDAENYIHKMVVDSSKFFEDEPAAEIMETEIPWKDANSQFSIIKVKLDNSRRISSPLIAKTKHKLSQLIGLLTYCNDVEIRLSFNDYEISSSSPKFHHYEKFVLNINNHQVSGKIGILDLNGNNTNRIWSGIHTYWWGNFIENGSLNYILPPSPVAIKRKICCFLHFDELNVNLWKNDFVWDKFSKQDMEREFLSNEIVKKAFYFAKKGFDDS